MKTTKEMIEVMQAYDIGDIIEERYLDESEDYWIACGKPIWDWNNFDYRVKPKTKYIPFDTAEEFLVAQRVHGEIVEDKESGKRINLYVNKNGTIVGTEFLSNIWIVSNLQNIFRCYQFKDGTPCGKEVKT